VEGTGSQEVILQLGPPEPLSPAHHTEEFACGEVALDDWLKRRALANQLSGASRTFVVFDSHAQVRGYYALAAGAVSHQIATGSVRRNMPDPIPVMVLARLAVDRQAQGRQLGGALLQDAVNRTIAVSRDAGVRALLVHALHDSARRFYEHYGFEASPVHALTLMLRLVHAKA
jgi:GNAT superfamily N-acetyltransferase